MRDEPLDLKDRVDIAAGRKPADLVLKNGRIVNVMSCEVHEGDVAIAGGRILGIGDYNGAETVDLKGMYVCPGLIDGHVHIESSMLSVPEFAKLVATCGTTAAITDPHEIANVMGSEGIRFMLSSSKYCPIHVFVMVSSCVPASPFESAGAELGAEDIQPLLTDRWVLGLAEMMNFPGVVSGDPECLAKLDLLHARPVDGHCPGLTGRDLCAYVATGIRSDHECTSLEEAREKLRLGMHILIREGSQAKDLDSLLPLVRPETLDRFSFCTDDKDVEDLLADGHIDHMIRRAVAAGLNPIHAIKLATINTARYFGLHHLGAVAPGWMASLAVVEDLANFRVRQTYLAGRLVAEDGVAFDPEVERRRPQVLRSSMNVHWLEPDQFAIRTGGAGFQPAADGRDARPTLLPVHVIKVLENRIDTGRCIEQVAVQDGELRADPQRDLCKVIVIERHRASGRMGKGFVRGFGMREGAIASTVAHDSHNMVVVGVDDADLFAAALHLVKRGGGFCVVRGGQVLADVPLPVAGLMSDADAATLKQQLERLHDAAGALGIQLRRPFMAMSFLTLSVIGALKITDQGLIDVERFQRIDLIAGR